MAAASSSSAATSNPALVSVARQAAEALKKASGLLVTAGAGIGVDSGLPDFRGTEGLWKEYPPLKHLHLDFADMANPDWFRRDPCFAWGFYGHRMMLYRRTVPHEGFSIMRRWGEGMTNKYFVFTSNVDGQFQKAGYAEDRIIECHGSIHFLQTLDGYDGEIHPADDITFGEIDPATLRVPEEEIPQVRGRPARPNILMFGDMYWEGSRTGAQQRRFMKWVQSMKKSDSNLVVVELGAGEAVPTVRRTSEAMVRQLGGTLLRINPRDSHVPHGVNGLSLACGSKEGQGLELIDSELAKLQAE
eukprot:CAMPEP_0206541660 /NCGR_PEP_ID=MMETSP0325_2-20121206/9738_1 /ASSEMBLY_ACC=CAM_ASM_000347 /TAXON_ID=2866 /ORGANISM="Crypthecodinium cohnii, Strain Seligo" /LENGTH=301 /DNA_ID=CAMNT_0054039627 /DNA_START=185 /DNA_END=1090 /DNA_ORIENTATION=-